MLKASSIIFALVISLVIGLISGSLILFSHFYRMEMAHYEVENRLIRNADSGINYLLAVPELVPPGQQKTIDLYGDGIDSVLLARKYWGGFEVVMSRAFHHRKSQFRKALVGRFIPEEKRVSLYLVDRSRPLSLCGETILDGVCYLPEGGVKRAYIEGQNYKGDKLVYGTKRISQKTLPDFNKELIAHNQNYLNHSFSNTDSIVGLAELESDSVQHSFQKKSLVIYDEDRIDLNGFSLKENIVVVSKRAITVGVDSKLNDIVLYAPAITIEEGFQGQIQAFASKNITVEKEVLLEYPSVLGCITKVNDSEEPVLTIDVNTVVDGVVFAQGKAQGRKELRVEVKANTTISGQLYVTGNLDLKGNVFGSVFCHKLVLKTPSSVYENHLLNVEINHKKLSPYFAGINLLENNGEKTIVKWIN
jgi:hypothetical protein